MSFRKVAFLALLVATPVFSAQAETTDTMTKQLIEVSRLYQAKPEESLKLALVKIVEESDAYLSEVASSGEVPPAALVDATHQVKQLIHS